MNTELVSTPPSIAIADRVRELSLQGVKVAKLQTGEPSFDTPEYIIEAAYTAMKEGCTHYSSSQGLPELRKSISKYYSDKYGIKPEPENITVHNGGIHAVFCVLSAILEEGDEVIIPEPYWPQYKFISVLNGAKVKNLDTRADQGKLTPDVLARYISDRTRVVIINNPVNPTGSTYSANELSQLLNIASANDVYILFDEVYSEIVYSDNYSSVMALPGFDEYSDNILYVNSFSKTYAMTGWRVGYSILPQHVCKDVLKISQNTVTNTNTFCQVAAAEAINKRLEKHSIFDQMLEEYKSRYHLMLEVLKDKNVQFIEPQGAFYFFIKCNRPSFDFANELLEKHHIAVVPGSAYGEFYDDYFRVSYAIDEYSFNTFISWLNENADQLL